MATPVTVTVAPIVQKLKDEYREKAKVVIEEKMPNKVTELSKIYEEINDDTKFKAIRTDLQQQMKLVLAQKQTIIDNIISNNSTNDVHNSNGSSMDDDDHASKKRKLNNNDGISSANNTNNKNNKFNEQMLQLQIEDIEVPCSKVILEMIAILKKELKDCISLINSVKLWIQLNIPRIEDGNNFGVGIQEEMVNELTRAETDSFNILENVTKYFVSRGKVSRLVVKHTGIKDYQESLIELDEREFLSLAICILDLRNNYAILYDMINKNKDKIEKPRSSHHSNMY